MIEVIDDGIGIDAKTLKKINSYLHCDDAITGEHVGLSNVDRKIKLMFGERYGLHIDNSFKSGTRIIIKQPL